MTEAEGKAAVTKAMLAAVERTWEYCEPDSAALPGIIRGGCARLLEGDFDPLYDSVSLAIALLTLARQRMLELGPDLEGALRRKAEG